MEERRALSDFAIRLAHARINAGFQTKALLARAIGLEEETYNRYERAETEPNLFTLAKIAETTRTSLDQLIRGRKPETEGERPLRKRA